MRDNFQLNQTKYAEDSINKTIKSLNNFVTINFLFYKATLEKY